MSQEDYENAIVTFFNKTDREQRKILCLGILVRPDWVFVTIQGYKKLKPFSETTAIIGRNILKSNLLGIQKIRPESNFIIVVMVLRTEVKSPLKFFPGVLFQEERATGQFIGWNSSGLMKVDGEYIFQYYARLIVEESVKAKLSNFPEGSLVIKGRNIIGVSYLNSTNINFYKITFHDYFHVQGLIQGVTPSHIESENSDSEMKNLDQGSASTASRRKRRIS